MLFKNATIYTMEQDPFVGDFKIDKGVFTQIGRNLTASEGEDVQDLNGLYVFPGLVESHCHLGMEETAIRFEGDDVNEYPQIQSHRICVELMDVIQWMKQSNPH